jgi:hypothetical protein
LRFLILPWLAHDQTSPFLELAKHHKLRHRRRRLPCLHTGQPRALARHQTGMTKLVVLHLPIDAIVGHKTDMIKLVELHLPALQVLPSSRARALHTTKRKPARLEHVPAQDA